MPSTTLRLYLPLGCLYVAQGLPFGFFMQGLPVLLRQQQVPLEWIGLSSLLGLPWALKWLWAPWIDRFGHARFGHYKSWILPLQLASCAACWSLGLLPANTAWLWFVLGSIISNALTASQDVATDGLAVHSLQPQQRGVGNALQVAGYRLGMIAGGGGLLWVLERWGWSLTLFTLGALCLLCSVPLLGLREAPRKASSAATLGSLLSFLRVGSNSRWLVLLCLYKTADVFATGMLRAFLVDRGLSLGQIAWLVGTCGSACGLLGAVLGGWFISRRGTQRALFGFALLNALSVVGYWVAAAGYLPLTHGSPGQLSLAASSYLLVGFEHLASGMATVALFSAMMQYCRTGTEASDYTVQASLVVVCTGLAATLSGFSAGQLGHVLHFALGAAVCVVNGLLLWRWVRLPAAA